MNLCRGRGIPKFGGRGVGSPSEKRRKRRPISVWIRWIFDLSFVFRHRPLKPWISIPLHCPEPRAETKNSVQHAPSDCDHLAASLQTQGRSRLAKSNRSVKYNKKEQTSLCWNSFVVQKNRAVASCVLKFSPVYGRWMTLVSNALHSRSESTTNLWLCR